MYPTVSTNRIIQSDYVMMRNSGESHNMAEMLALQKFPFAKSVDRMLFENNKAQTQFNNSPKLVEYAQEAEAKGVNTAGAIYMGGLARYPGDERAWVHDENDIRRIAKEDNLTVRGLVNVQATQLPPTPAIPVADDLVEERAFRIVANNPTRAKDMEEVREQARESLLPNYSIGA